MEAVVSSENGQKEHWFYPELVFFRNLLNEIYWRNVFFFMEIWDLAFRSKLEIERGPLPKISCA